MEASNGFHPRKARTGPVIMQPMKRTRLTVILVLLVLIPASGIIYLLAAPRLIAVTPQANTQDVAAISPLHLEFSRHMDSASVNERFQIIPETPGNITWENRGHTLVFTPSKPWPSGETIQVRLASGAQASGFLPFTIRQEASWSFTIGQPHLVYLFPSDGAPNLYMLNPFDGETHQLTNYLQGVVDYDVDHQGSLAYYSVEVPDGSLIFVITDLIRSNDQVETSSTPTLAVNCERARCTLPRLAPDGRFLAYERTAFPAPGVHSITQVWVLPLEQGLPTNEFEPRLIGDATHQTLQPQWSPTGLLLYYDTTDSAYIVVDPEGAEIRRFPNTTGYPGSWHPSGDFFIAPEINYDGPLPAEAEPPGVSFLIRYRLEDGDVSVLSVRDTLEDAFPEYSPTGSLLAYSRKYMDTTRWTPGRQAWLMDADGGNAHAITDEPVYNHFAYTWSPDGKMLVYVRFHQTELTQAPEIWVYDMNIQNSWRLLRGGFAPRWIP